MATTRRTQTPEETPVVTPDGSPQYPAEHFLKSNWYSHRRGELGKLLEEGKEYSYTQVERMLSGR